MSHTVTKEVTISDEQINDLMVSALQGISYWASEAEIVHLKSKDDGLYTSEALTHGYAVRIYDAEEECWHKLTLNKFLKGVAKMDHQDFYEYDMFDADKVIQYALFGEQVYA